MKRIVATTAVLSVLAACGGPAGGSTPEDCFTRTAKAAESKDWKTVFLCHDPEKADDLLGFMVLGFGFEAAGNREVGKEMERLLEKHGIKKAKEAGKEALKDVKDKAAFFADMMAVMEKHTKGKSPSAELAGANLKDVKVEGDRAAAKAVRPDGKTTDARFVRRNNRWYLAVDVE